MKIKRIIILIIIISSAIAFASCSPSNILENFLNNADTSESDRYLELVFKSITDKDYAELNEEFEYPMTDGEFNDFTDSIEGFVKGELTNYSLAGYYVNKSTSGKSTSTSYEYRYNTETTDGKYMVQIILISEDGGPKEFMGLHFTEGAVEGHNLKAVGISFWQIVVLVYAALSYAFIIFAIVKCAKSKVRLKALWIIGSLFQIGAGFSISPGTINFSFKFYLFGLSQLLLNGKGDVSIMIFFPAVAFIFVLLKKFLERKSEKRLNDFKAQEEELSIMSQQRIENKEKIQSEILDAGQTEEKDE